MSVSAAEFRLGMRRLGGAVNIITTNHKGVLAGLTATAVTSLSAEPPRLLACLNSNGFAYEAVKDSLKMCVNVLSAEHKDLAMRFGGMKGGDESDRFTDDCWESAVTGSPVLKGAQVAFDCEISEIIDQGSHGIFIGDIKQVLMPEEQPSDPLFYAGGDWASLRNL